MSHDGVFTIYHNAIDDFVGSFECRVILVIVTSCLFCSSFFKLALLVCKQCSFTSFVDNFVHRVSHEASYDVIEILVVEIEVLLALE